jgi:transcriptional regulator with XRE-family HTH domain
MPSVVRPLDEIDRVTARSLRASGDEFHERRLELSISQAAVAGAARMSRNHYAAIENGTAAKASLRELNRVAAVLGLEPSYRLYPGGRALRDGGHATKLRTLASWLRSPLTIRFEVALPAVADRFERRAWDAMIFADGRRTGLELEMRLRDVQAMRRRIDLKRRDDPVESFVLLVADTRNNRRVVAEFADLFADLPSLRASAVRSVLAAGQHPPTGLLLI